MELNTYELDEIRREMSAAAEVSLSVCPKAVGRWAERLMFAVIQLQWKAKKHGNVCTTVAKNNPDCPPITCTATSEEIPEII